MVSAVTIPLLGRRVQAHLLAHAALPWDSAVAHLTTAAQDVNRRLAHVRLQPSVLMEHAEVQLALPVRVPALVPVVLLQGFAAQRLITVEWVASCHLVLALSQASHRTAHAEAQPASPAPPATSATAAVRRVSVVQRTTTARPAVKLSSELATFLLTELAEEAMGFLVLRPVLAIVVDHLDSVDLAGNTVDKVGSRLLETELNQLTEIW